MAQVEPPAQIVYKDNDIAGEARVHFGNSYNTHVYNHPTSAPPDYKLGLSLSGAPQIDTETFVGREAEVEQLEKHLLDRPAGQNIVAIWGLGGIGKTQLSIHFAKRHQSRYSSVIWLNAKDENTLKAGLDSLASRISGTTEHEVGQSQPGEDQAVQFIRQWLSKPENNNWLLIFDNYDDPCLPGIQSSTGYDIREFFPHRAQGSIIITTRSSRIRFAKQVRLSKLEDIQQSLAILAKVSGRETETDLDAHKLAKRLDGLPLALTTAGVYISQTADSFGDYLQMYEESWEDLEQNSDELLEYEDRTLYSTWNLSMKQVEEQDPDAAQLLRLIAYLGNRDLWYELFKGGPKSGPEWLSNVTQSKPKFNKAMGKLLEYSLVEVEVGAQPGQYSLHSCVHDWTLEHLNCKSDGKLYPVALSCISNNTMHEREPNFWKANRRLIPHVIRSELPRITKSVDWNSVSLGMMYNIAYLNQTAGRVAEAEAMYLLALKASEVAQGSDHKSTLRSVNSLGSLYREQGRNKESEAMYQRALDAYEKTLGSEHILTLRTVNNLGNLYADEGRSAEAEPMYQRVLAGYEKALGSEHISTLNKVHNLGTLYADQGRNTEAEAMYQRALDGYGKLVGQDHTWTLDTVINLGSLYQKQNRIAEAEAMYQRAHDGYEMAWGPDHASTLNAATHLGSLYQHLGRYTEAEAIFRRVLTGYEKTLGMEHLDTLLAIDYLAHLRHKQGDLQEALKLYERASTGFVKSLGPSHKNTISCLERYSAAQRDLQQAPS